MLGVTGIGTLAFLVALKILHGGSTESGWIPGLLFWFIEGSIASLFGTKLIVLVFVAGAAAAIWYNRSDKTVFTLVTWVLAPIIGELLMTMFITPIFVERYLLSSIPPMILLVAIGMTAFKRPVVVSLLALVLGVEAFGMSHVDRSPREDWSLMTPEITTLPQKGDIIDIFPGDGSVGLMTQMKLTHTHLPYGTYLFPTTAPVLWSNEWMAGHLPDVIPPAYYAGHKHAVWVVVRQPEYWPTAVPFQAIVGLKQCFADTSKAVHLYKFAKSCDIK
jgi:hypothetical protein